MGRVGYLYDSVKDQIRWHKLSVKHYTKLISNIGQVMALRDEDYEKERVKQMKVSNIDTQNSLLSLFGG